MKHIKAEQVPEEQPKQATQRQDSNFDNEQKILATPAVRRIAKENKVFGNSCSKYECLKLVFSLT